MVDVVNAVRMSGAASARAVTRFRYRAQHAGLLAVTSPLMRAFHAAMNPRLPRPPREQLEALEQRLRHLLDDDLDEASRGVFPPELLFDTPWGDIARTWPALLVEVPRILVRKHRGDIHDLPLDDDERDRYPSYYLRTFHWQTDGWLSDRSARLYDPGVELLFGGTADVMRRRVLAPVLDAVRGLQRPQILDVACGTGRLLSQLGRALPHAHLTGVDLSRPYLEHARAALDDVDVEVDLLAVNAESQPFKDGLFDAVTCVYLFHELPRDARRRVAREMFRVLRPGGTLVMLDSAQLHDGADIAAVLSSFPAVYHEPYYASFLRDPASQILEEAGFVVEDVQPAFVSSRVVARRPWLT